MPTATIFILSAMLFWAINLHLTSADDEDEDDDEETVRSVSLKLHNRHRENAGLKPLEWDEDLEESASEYSKKLGKKYDCEELVHSDDRKDIGENLSRSRGYGYDEVGEAKRGCITWYNEVNLYRYNGNKDYLGCGGVRFMEVGHLTQMMWHSTKKLGCGGYSCGPKKGVVFTCHYKPGGNYEKQPMFREENFIKLCAKEANWTSCDKKLMEKCPDANQRQLNNLGNLSLIVGGNYFWTIPILFIHTMNINHQVTLRGDPY